MSDIKRSWAFYVDDMLRFAHNALAYSEGLTQEQFVASGLNFDATLRNLELIGEAATHIPEAIKSRYSDIPWRMMIATRNRIIHGYLGIDNDIVWSIIQEELPLLIDQLEKIER